MHCGASVSELCSGWCCIGTITTTVFALIYGTAKNNNYCIGDRSALIRMC